MRNIYAVAVYSIYTRTRTNTHANIYVRVFVYAYTCTLMGLASNLNCQCLRSDPYYRQVGV